MQVSLKTCYANGRMIDELDVGITLDRRIDISGSISPFDDRCIESINNKMAKLKQVHFVSLTL